MSTERGDQPADKASSAVFLSYARNDLPAAHRLRDAFVAAGLEVFFDLRGLESGDDFDALIRRHIHDCNLFVPIISATTQSRPEAYFRLEWHLAEERARLMAKGVAFILPVVIDDTAEAGALVPDKFLQVQWTRLPGGVPTPEFVQRVVRLTKNRMTAVHSTAPFTRQAETAPASSPRRKWPLVATVLAMAGMAAAALWWRNSPQSSAPTAVVAPINEKSIAVLPFANLSPDPNNAFFADGIHEDVITSLAKIHDLKVISRTSVLAYRDLAQRNLRKIAAELGVATVLEGSVRREDKKVRVTIQLIDAKTDRHLWAEKYDHDLSDVFTLQTALAEEITRALKVSFTGGERALIARRPTQNQDAYDLYTHARTMQLEIGLTGTPEQFEKVTSLYEQAIAKDPNFTLAYVQLAVTHGFIYFFGGLDPTVARLERMRVAAEAARRIAPDLPEARLALGAYRLHALDPVGSLVELQAAEAGLPNDAQLQFFLGAALSELGRISEALGYFEKSAALNPADLATIQLHIQALLMLRRFAPAQEMANRYAKRFPEYRRFAEMGAKAKFGSDGDYASLLRTLETLPPAPTEAGQCVDAYWAAMRRGDFAAAERALANPRLVGIPNDGEILIDPPALHRALLAFATGRPELARSAAEEAIAYYRSRTWTPRQSPWAQMRVAWAEALAGRPEQAVQHGNKTFAALGSPDCLDALWMRSELGYVYLMTGRSEEALTLLQKMMSGPCWPSPHELRVDPLWSQLKADPRFEKTLSAAKRL